MRTRRGRHTTDESLDQVLRHTDQLGAVELVALLWFVQLAEDEGGPTDAELEAFGGREQVGDDLVRNLRNIAHEDAIAGQPRRFRAHCRCVWCSRRRSTLLSLKGVS